MRLNPKRRLAAAARKAQQAARNAAHPAIRSPKGLGVSVVHLDSLLVSSHTPGFSGAGRGVGRETSIIRHDGFNEAKSRMTPDDVRTFNDLRGRPIRSDVSPELRAELEREVIPYVRYTAPKSEPFACRAPREVYTNDDPLRKTPQFILVKRGKGKFKRL